MFHGFLVSKDAVEKSCYSHSLLFKNEKFSFYSTYALNLNSGNAILASV